MSVNDSGDFIGSRSTEYYTPDEPVEQVEEREEEERNLNDEYPLLAEVILQLDTDIALYKSVDSIPSEVTLKPEECAITIQANQKAAKSLLAVRDRLKSMVDSYSPGE